MSAATQTEASSTAKKPGSRPQLAPFPIQIPLQYRLINKPGDAVRGGAGRSRTPSRKSVVFEAAETLLVGHVVKLFLDWPVRLQNRVNLTLVLHGEIVQAEGGCMTVEIST